MSLTIGTGPLSPEAAGEFNAALDLPDRLLLFDPYLPRVRALFGGETVVDSLGTKLLHETGRLPVFYFPLSDVRMDMLEARGRSEHVPGKGVASYRSLRAGDRTAPDAAWVFEEPVAEASFLRGHVAFEWAAIDEWFTEDEQLFGHPRDPYSRIDVLKSTRHVRISLHGELLAESRRPNVLYETALPPRFYLPVEDVRDELLVPSPRRTRCAYKGSASYWHVRVGDRLVEDLVWTYRDPEHDARPVADQLCFFNERVDLEVDGERQTRPRTQWSRDDA
jgi:uncharacterized protein (DUF427 family)